MTFNAQTKFVRNDYQKQRACRSLGQSKAVLKAVRLIPGDLQASTRQSSSRYSGAIYVEEALCLAYRLLNPIDFATPKQSVSTLTKIKNKPLALVSNTTHNAPIPRARRRSRSNSKRPVRLIAHLLVPGPCEQPFASIQVQPDSDIPPCRLHHLLQRRNHRLRPRLPHIHQQPVVHIQWRVLRIMHLGHRLGDVLHHLVDKTRRAPFRRAEQLQHVVDVRLRRACDQDDVRSRGQRGRE